MEKGELIMEKEDIKKLIIAGLLAVGMLAGAYFIVIYEPEPEMTAIENVDIYSELVSTDPMQSAANFITANGTMGSIENDITQEKMKTNEATYENSHRRLLALSRVTNAVIPGSPLITGREEDNISKFTMDLDSPVLYKVDNVVVSEPSEPQMLTIFSETGPIEYDSVDVTVTFDSTRIHYSRVHDVTYDGTHTQLSIKESFETKVTLVQVDELWFIYDIENAEELLNERFATWSGSTNSNIDYTLMEETGEFILEGITPYNE